MTIKDCLVKGTQINGKGNLISGMIASCNRFTATNCNIEDIEINNDSVQIEGKNIYRATAGIIASATGAESQMKNCNVKGLDIIARSKTSGGLIGFTTQLDVLDDCTVDGFTVTNDLVANVGAGSIAGLVGDLGSSILTTNNCKVQNTQLTGNSENIGGMFGSTVAPITINNAIVDNVDLINKNVYSSISGNLGGLIGTALSEVVVTNAQIKNSDIKVQDGDADSHHIGGIVGFSNETTITNSNVKDTAITNNTKRGTTGGLVGMVNYVNAATEIVTTLTLTNSGITSTSVKGSGATGGIIGFGKLNSVSGYVNNGTITGITAGSEIGGAIGNGLPASDIKQIDITNSDIHSQFRVGGIAGFANNTISECNVTNCIINATATVARGLGGIVGHGSNYTATSTYIYKCLVSGCKLTGVTGVGGIAGVAVANIEECTVSGEVTQQEIQNAVGSQSPIQINEVQNNELSQGNGTNINSDNQVQNDKNIVGNSGLQDESKNVEEQNLIPVQPIQKILTTTEMVDVYSSIIKGTDSVGGIIGDAGQLTTGNTFTTLTNCIINNTNIIGKTNTSESIGKNSCYTEGESTIYDIITNLIKTNCKITIEE